MNKYLNIEDVSRPSRARGLKPDLTTRKGCDRIVAPLAGARIETSAQHLAAA